VWAVLFGGLSVACIWAGEVAIEKDAETEWDVYPSVAEKISYAAVERL
jgi:hypothetical protein